MNALEGEAKLLIRELKTLELVKLIETEELQRIPKSAQVSERARKQGNALYVKQHHTTEEHFEILKFYCKSITFAPNQSEELACAYGNRSALLFHLKKWSECIQDVERALAITLDENLKIKLTKRRDKSLQLFNLTIELEKRRKELSSQLNGHNSDEKLKNLDESSKLSLENNNDNLLSRKKLCDSVKIQHSAKYGRYLAAKRDIRPGEIILVEKPYVNSFNTQNLYLHCGHCLAVNWAGVPCEHCGWMMYCSEKCRKDAWEQYHDIECFCIFYICYFSNHAKEYTGKEIRFDGIGIRVLLKALKEAGSLEKLKVQMKSVDQCADPCKRGFSKNGRFESDKFISLYSLSHSVSRSEKKGLAIFAAIALTCIAKYTKFFGEAFKFSVNALLESSYAIFIGSLLLRLSTISSINSHCVLNATDKCKYFRDEEKCREKWCCTRGTCILPIASLTNNNCSPNASRCYTEDQKLILFAIQPIKKNSQIFDTYYCSYYDGEQILRQKILKETFNFVCDCIACKKNWPCYDVLKTSLELAKPNSGEVNLWIKHNNLIKNIKNKSIQFDAALLHDVSKLVEKSVDLPQPSAFTCDITESLKQVFETLYGYSNKMCKKC